MGTKAVFAIQHKEDDKIFNTIIGMTSDGTPDNLDVLASACISTAKKLRVLRKFREYNSEAVKKVMKTVADNNGLFVDNIDNASWVSYSAIFDPAKKTVSHYEGKLEDYTHIRQL